MLAQVLDLCNALVDDIILRGKGEEIGMLEQKTGPWDYRMLPNKMYELVKNVGNMEQEGTSYYADSESEMLTILSYLNYGEKTNITESMCEQIDQAVENLEKRRLGIAAEGETADTGLGLSI